MLSKALFKTTYKVDDTTHITFLPGQKDVFPGHANKDVEVYLSISADNFHKHQNFNVFLGNDITQSSFRFTGDYVNGIVSNVYGSMTLKSGVFPLQIVEFDVTKDVISIVGVFHHIGWDWLIGVGGFSGMINNSNVMKWEFEGSSVVAMPGQRVQGALMEFDDDFFVSFAIPAKDDADVKRGRFIMQSQVTGFSYVFDVKDGLLVANPWCSVEMRQIPVELRGGCLVNSRDFFVQGFLPVIDFVHIESYTSY